MLLRFFLFIWGSIILTVAVVVLIVSQLNLGPPENQLLKMITPSVQEAGLGAYHRGGEAAVRAMLADSAGLSKGFAILADPAGSACTGQGALGLNDQGQCLRLVAQGVSPDWLERLLPILLPVLAGLTISIPAGMLLARRIAAPLRIIGSGMADLSQGDLTRRISGELAGSDAELAALGQAFDAAATRLQALSDSRDHLFHDLSHEIRSPLARLQAALGVLSVNPSRLNPMLQRMGDDIGRINALLEELLTLARIEHTGPMPQDWKEIDLIDLLDPIIADAHFERQAAGIRCQFHGPETLPLLANPELLHRAFENVIRNALKFTQDGSAVEVIATATSESITILVHDCGPGAAPAEIPGLFLPFVRGSHLPERAGSGLGLAIAARAIAIHHGDITAENRAEGGLTVRIHLPRQVHGA